MEEKYATKVDLLQTKIDIENNLNNRIDNVDEKVDTLNQLVLPLIESSKQTAKNTEKMTTVLEEFTKDQRKRNGEFYDKLHEQEKALENLDTNYKYSVDEKGIRAKIVVAVITTVGAILTAVFGLAPLLFN